VAAEKVMPLPGGEPDTSSDETLFYALSDNDRHIIADIFAKRAHAELCVSAVFAQITRELVEAGTDEPVLELAARAVGDEVRHAKLWLKVAAHYRGSDVAWPDAVAAQLPTYPGAEPWLAPALRIVGMSCINETIATVRLRECMDNATSALVRQTMHEILTDEIHHARLGWAYLASPRVTSKLRAAVSSWLVRLLSANVSALFNDVESSLGDAFVAHGIPSNAQTRTVAAAAVHELVLPGFIAVGLDVAEAQEWARRELPLTPEERS
jgi:hypothetical protein